MDPKSKKTKESGIFPQPSRARASPRSSDEQESSENSPGTETSSCLITPTNISIGRLYVYNFTSPGKKGACSIEIPISGTKIKVQSPGASSGPICRICHEGDHSEDLISPCNCAGTVGLIHLSCMEKWLSLAGSDKCEICNYTFITLRSPKSFIEWLRSSAQDPQLRRSLVSDLLCLFLLTPLAGVSSFLCIEGAKKQILVENSLEAGCLMALATFLVTIYFIWNVLTCRYHLNNYLKWRSLNQNVKVRVGRLSSPLLPHDFHPQDLEDNSETIVEMPRHVLNSESLTS